MDDKPQPHTNGSLNGSNGTNGVNANSATIAPRRNISSKGQRGFLPWSFGIVARLLTWYTIFTIIFRCPASLDACNESSPKICEPYFHAKHAIAPHVSPYYDAYAAPYIDLARPYYNTFDRKVIIPGRAHAVKYGGPRLAQVQAYGRAQWERSVQPQILEYQALAKVQYDRAISPYVDQAATIIAPYYDIARTNALQTYHEFLVPTYTFVQPYATQSYDAAYGLTKHTIIPSVIWLWNKTYAFIDSAVWPHLRDIYVLKVEPQLVRIGERLGRYREKRTKPAVEETEPITYRSTFVKPTSSISSIAVSTTTEPTYVAFQEPNVDEYREPEASPDSPKTKEEIRELAAKTVAEDLDLWESKFSQVAEEGASEIEDRVEEISTRMIKNHAHVTGKSLVLQLERTIHIELESLKKTILDILEKTQNNPEKRDEKIAAAVRGAGVNIRNKAQSIRDWRQSYEQATEIAVTDAAEEHFTILQRTRDLGLQKIGMKWAWMDGITYKDWQKYHQLKDRFEEWLEGLKRLITTHPGLARAMTAGTDIEDEAMAIAHEAAMELGRLKQVAAWKAIAQDFSDDFESSTMQLAAEVAEERIAAIAEAARLARDATVEPSMTSTDTTDESRSKKTAISTEDSTVSSTVMDADESHPSYEQEDSDTSASPPTESLAAEPTDSVTNLSSEYLSASDPKSADSPGHTISVAESVKSPPNPNSIDGQEQMVETMESPDSPIDPIDEEVTSTTVKSALFGAAAEPVPARHSVLDDMVSPATTIPSIAQSAVNLQPSAAMQKAHSADELAASASPTTSSPYVAVSSLVSELMAGKEPSYTQSVYSRLSQAYESSMPSPSSSSSVSSATAARVTSKIHDASTSDPEAAIKSTSSITKNLKGPINGVNDEL
ncbi:hypothetical protein F4861DRAFT_489454 [Xylaria intraflava]|nr:hypothetical protein F4861DRAFT_489454 [Xylaria intraflava]